MNRQLHFTMKEYLEGRIEINESGQFGLITIFDISEFQLKKIIKTKIPFSFNFQEC